MLSRFQNGSKKTSKNDLSHFYVQKQLKKRIQNCEIFVLVASIPNKYSSYHMANCYMCSHC
jgi:hypothetical protein